MNLDQVNGTAKVQEKSGHGLPVTCATCAPEEIAVIDKKEAYDSLDAFCAEYGFDAATKQRMRVDMLSTALKTVAAMATALNASRRTLPHHSASGKGRILSALGSDRQPYDPGGGGLI